MTKRYGPFETVAMGEIEWSQFHEILAKSTGGIANTGNASVDGDKLEVYADGSGMTVYARSGRAIVRGFLFSSDATEALTISAADATNPRIDRVVLRVDMVNDTVDFAILQGTPAASPAPPALTQSTYTWEIPLAQVWVAAGTAIISAGDITDERVYLSGASIAPSDISPQGTGSGLDADSVDGMHASDFALVNDLATTDAKAERIIASGIATASVTSGAITVDPAVGSVVTVSPESGTTDGIHTINGGAAGDIVLLTAAPGTYLYTEVGGNVIPGVGIEPNKWALFRFDGTQWISVAGPGVRGSGRVRIIHLDPSLPTSQLLDIINSQPKYIAQNEIVKFVHTGGTHVATEPLLYTGFYGPGTLSITAETEVSGLTTGQTSIIDVSGTAAAWFEVSGNTCRVSVSSLKVVSGDETYGMRFIDNGAPITVTSCYSQHGGKTNYGIAIQVQNSNVRLVNVYVSNASVGVRVDYTAFCHMMDCASTGILPDVGVTAWGGTAHRGGTSFITGSVRDVDQYHGGVVT